jgi:hypothetical protein
MSPSITTLFSVMRTKKDRSSHFYFSLKMKASGSYKTFVPIDQSTRHHTTETIIPVFISMGISDTCAFVKKFVKGGIYYGYSVSTVTLLLSG